MDQQLTDILFEFNDSDITVQGAIQKIKALFESGRKEWDVRVGEWEVGRQNISNHKMSLKDFYIKDGMWVILHQKDIIEYWPVDSCSYIGRRLNETEE